MAWLRIDDDFVRHPKIGALTDPQFRTWIRVLCYCAEYHTGGRIPEAAEAEIQGWAKHRTRYAALALVDIHPDRTWHVHDWNTYNRDPTHADRQARYRENRERRNDQEVTEKVTAEVTAK